ncbi:MAG: hypothetical protein KDB01_10565 [Planctomycetaceae bacterium]|nr:hypothetical protein [Planctomycetaceae bacterium]
MRFLNDAGQPAVESPTDSIVLKVTQSFREILTTHSEWIEWRTQAG